MAPEGPVASNVIDLDEARARREAAGPSHPVLDALDALALALAGHGHVWSAEERAQYEHAVELLRGGG